MNERLSRSDRHGRSRGSADRSRRIVAHDKLKDAASEMIQEVSEPAESILLKEDVQEVSLESVGDNLQVESSPAEKNLDMTELPTRKEMFPSQRIKLTRWFYNSLLYIFVAIMIFLLWWGISDSPWGESHGL
ncbi:hypothetical protein DFP94_101824 [Fontibacillus phaseoli]|uniref:Uncharacterized protein n=1 Tax=Fontibacillus phaseoli TaxID=1416533 RepID=A0A369BRD6_9BACL|nr:hypothetical protein [Fontibacillus phaseoli]RCX23228.1 hypothetical protein DFP94_101824 [Fontibacillus phaseoli]